MANEPMHLDPLEHAWSELEQAEKAGVFLRTRVGAAELVYAPVRVTSVWSRRVFTRLLPVAAAIALAVALWGWFSRSGQDGQIGRLAFHDCFGGPTAEAMTVCREHDYDTDGDVDLADFSAFQLAFATMTR